MGDAGGQHAGLAGAGAGQHQNRAVERLDGVALLRIEADSRMSSLLVETSAFWPRSGPMIGIEDRIDGKLQGGRQLVGLGGKRDDA
jgi:hypothetical protein